MQKQNEQGRSMVEMLGTLAIMGVLSAGAIGGYSYAMNKHRTNELIYEATKRAQWVGTQLEMNNPNPSLNTFGTDSFGGGTFGEVTILDNNQFGIAVTGLKEAVCHNILNSIGDNTVIREMRDVNCSGNNGTATLVFNRDLSVNDSEATPDEPEVIGESSEQASTEAPVTQNPDDEHCSGNGSWNGSSCACDPDWDGEDCSEKETEASETETSNEPEEPTLDCGEHGEQAGNACLCEDGWTGDTCEVESTDPETYENQPCNDNDDCGEYGTYFCKYTRVNCTTGPTAQGKCTKTSTIRGSGDGYVWSTTTMDWFSAANFCAASGKEMISFDDLNCPYTLAQYKSNGNWGYCCADGSNDINSGCGANVTAPVTAEAGSVVAEFSSGIQVIQAAGVPLQYYWTKTLTDNSCGAFYVPLNLGYVSGYTRDGYYYALCE